MSLHLYINQAKKGAAVRLDQLCGVHPLLFSQARCAGLGSLIVARTLCDHNEPNKIQRPHMTTQFCKMLGYQDTQRSWLRSFIRLFVFQYVSFVLRFDVPAAQDLVAAVGDAEDHEGQNEGPPGFGEESVYHRHILAFQACARRTCSQHAGSTWFD